MSPTVEAIKGMIQAVTGARSADEELADEELAARAQRGERRALDQLLRRYVREIHKLTHYLVGPTEGPDAAQLALEKIIARIDSYDPSKGAFRTWALTVARNTVRDRLRRKKLEARHFAKQGDEIATDASAKGPGPERLALARFGTADLARALDYLPEGQRSAIVLFHVHEASYTEIAETLGIPKGTVMTWLHRGRKKLQTLLEEGVPAGATIGVPETAGVEA